MAAGDPLTGNCFQKMFEAMIDINDAYNQSIVVDGQESTPLSSMQTAAYANGQSWLNVILQNDISGKTGDQLSQGQVAYNQANSTVNNVSGQCGNLVSKATNDVNTDSQQSQEALQWGATINQAMSSFTSLLAQGFAA